MILERGYREDLARLRDEKKLAPYAKNICSELGKYLRKIGASGATQKTPGKLVADLLSFLGYGTFEAYEAGLKLCCSTVSTRMDSTNEIDAALFMVWKEAGKRTEKFQTVGETSFDEEKLRAMLPTLRKRTSRPDDTMLGEVAEMLSEVGVTLQFVEPPEKLKIYGFTDWVDERFPIIQQSGRRKKDGQIVWTLFHELGHVLYDDRSEMCLDSNRKTTKKAKQDREKRANDFAKETIFGEGGLKKFYCFANSQSLRDEALRAEVCPGVIVKELRRVRRLQQWERSELMTDIFIPMENIL